MKIINSFWRKITHGKDLEEAGPLEKSFFESVYRLSYITGLSTSDVDVKYMIYSSTIRIVSALVVICEIWRVLGDNLSLDEIISCINVISIHMITIWKLMIMSAQGPNDVYVRKGALESLAADLKATSPDLNPEVFKETAIYREGNMGYYLTENLREYLTGASESDVKSTDRGMIITITFDPPKTADDEKKYDEQLEHIVYLLRQAGVEHSLVSEDESYIKPMLEYYNTITNAV
ncbi:unnamed protein product [Chrysodeixis includens]|uniref:Uncharacterized protein n=1 Tax=Chrysodeixis includens TaxID=689277 RepID=A0A9N8KTK7_CHRIL|nr:unnamed protein product [Chrysodeixis includens]